jgi:hypothetical protein
MLLIISKSKLSIKRWAAGVFGLDIYGVIITIILTYASQPPPVETPSFSGHGSGYIALAFLNLLLLVAVIIVIGLSAVAIARMLRNPSSNEAPYLAGVCIVIGLLFYYFGGDWMTYSRIFFAFWVFILLACINVIALLRLRKANRDNFEAELR